MHKDDESAFPYWEGRSGSGFDLVWSGVEDDCSDGDDLSVWFERTRAMSTW